MKRCIPLLLALCLLLSLGSPALADDVLWLPSSLKSIEDEAFNGDAALDEAVLPEGIESIGKGAFANSSLTKINLPPSLKTIGKNALPAPGTVAVTANEGTDAYNWAVEKGYIVPEGSVGITAASFPDATFRAYVSENFDTDGDGALSRTEAGAVTEIHVSGLGIATLRGIEHFPLLSWLECDGNRLTALDLSGNPMMSVLTCYHNQIEVLALYPCPWLCGWTQTEAETRADYGEDVLLYTDYLIVDADTCLVTSGKETHLTADFALASYQVNPGETAILSVKAACDEEPLTYRWYMSFERVDEDGIWGAEWVFLSGAAGPSITTQPIYSLVTYHCYVSDPYGAVVHLQTDVSVVSTLRVRAADNRYTICVSSGETATLTVVASGDAPPFRYQWYDMQPMGDDSIALIPIDGATEPSFTTGPITSAASCAVRVIDACGNSQAVWFSVSAL